MSIVNSNYFKSLPPFFQEDVLRSGVYFENDEELNSFLASRKDPIPPLFGVGYSQLYLDSSYYLPF